VGEHERKGQLGRSRRTREDNIKVEFQAVGLWEEALTGLTWLGTGTGDFHLKTRL
jgi:hypothetical protein